MSATAGVYHGRFHDPETGDLVEWTEERMAYYFALARRMDQLSGASMLGSRVPGPAELEPLYERYYCWKYGAEEGSSIYLDELCPYLLEIYQARAAALGKPLAEVFRGTVYLIPPLKLGVHEAYQVQFFRERGLRVGIGDMYSLGANAPVTLAGGVALNIAEQLALRILDWAWFGLKRLHLGGSISPIDMRTLIHPFGRPEMAIANLMMAHMARFYRASYSGHAGLSDAKLPSVEAGYQKALTAIPTLLACGSLWMDAGLLSIDEVYSPVQMVLDNEFLSAIRRFIVEFEISDETIGLETILEAGPGGQYLDKQHTVRHMRREHWQPSIWSREMLGPWLEGPRRLDAGRAREVALQVWREMPGEPASPRPAARIGTGNEQDHRPRTPTTGEISRLRYPRTAWFLGLCQSGNERYPKDDMNSRERFQLALHHQEPDRMPVAFSGPECSIHHLAHQNLLKHLGLVETTPALIIDNCLQIVEPDHRLYALFGVDVVWLMPREGDLVWESNGEKFTDDLRRRFIYAGGFFNQAGFPLQTGEQQELARYNFPDVRSASRIAGLAEKAQKLWDEGFGLVADGPWGLYEICSSLRGTEALFMDLAVNQNCAEILAERVLEEYLKPLYESILRVVGGKVQMVMISDDLGSQHNLLFSPRIFRTVFKPRLKRLVEHIRAFTNAKVYIHSDGAVSALIPDFIEIGLDGLNPIHYTAAGMESARVKREFGRDFGFFGGGIDNQILSTGSPGQVRAEVKKQIEILAPDGGYLFATIHNISQEVPPENVVAFFNAAQEFGQYPIGG